VNHDVFTQRLAVTALSRWELADLLGIHPHELQGVGGLRGLADQPVRVLIELSRRLDLHPADIVGDLEPLLTTRRPPASHPATGTCYPPDGAPGAASDEMAGNAGTATEESTDRDALTLLTALATTSIPLTIEDLATVLGCPLERTCRVLEHAQSQPELGGPVALRRVPPHAWTVTARHDVLTPAQHGALLKGTYHRAPLAEDDVTVLLAVLTHGTSPDYAGWRQHHLEAEHTLKVAGLIESPTGPHHARLHPDVRYSLDPRYDVPV
jgi:hypothetical protein